MISSCAPWNVSLMARASGSRRGRNSIASSSRRGKLSPGGLLVEVEDTGLLGGEDTGVPGVAAHVAAATVVFAVHRERVLRKTTGRTVVPPLRLSAQVQQPAAGQGDQAVKADAHAVDRRQGDPMSR